MPSASNAATLSTSVGRHGRPACSITWSRESRAPGERTLGRGDPAHPAVLNRLFFLLGGPSSACGCGAGHVVSEPRSFQNPGRAGTRPRPACGGASARPRARASGSPWPRCLATPPGEATERKAETALHSSAEPTAPRTRWPDGRTAAVWPGECRLEGNCCLGRATGVVPEGSPTTPRRAVGIRNALRPVI